MLVGGGAVQGCRANSTAQVIPLLLPLLILLLLLLFVPEPLPLLLLLLLPPLLMLLFALRQVHFRDFMSVGGGAPAAAVAQPAPKRAASRKRTGDDLPPAVAKKASEGAATSRLPKSAAATAAANANRKRGLHWNASAATIQKCEEAQRAEAKRKEQLDRQDGDWGTYLLWAAARGDDAVVALLLGAVADPNQAGAEDDDGCTDDAPLGCS